MGFFDDVANKSMLNSKLNKLNLSLKENYNQLGMRYYNLYKENPDPVLKELVDSITSDYAEIKQTEKDLALLRGMVICPNCSTECSVQINFCTKCGTKLIKPEQPKPAVQPPVVQAPVQPTPVPPAPTVIEQPTLQVPAQPVVQPVQKVQEQSVDTPAVQNLEESPVEDIYSASADFAPEQNIIASEESVEVQSVAVEEPPVEEVKAQPEFKFCTQCGNKVKFDAVFCTKCGNKFNS